MTDAELQKIRHQLAVYNSLFRPEAEALLAEVYRLRAALLSIASKPSIDPLANAMRAAEALAPPAAE